MTEDFAGPSWRALALFHFPVQPETAVLIVFYQCVHECIYDHVCECALILLITLI